MANSRVAPKQSPRHLPTQCCTGSPKHFVTDKSEPLKTLTKCLSVAAPAQWLDLAERLLQVGGCLMVSKVSGQESAMDTWFELLLVNGVQARV
ncbi:hypothetical protein RRG08_020834 [Elysia crispata]|uniref:Uncharacterized protein n=1 Tax=Elysia crispata TaxID=231223 RepID=A0AAE1CMT8_9GAST|nr:hypothetical protein RRG08_020834 [Elysia crispata]